MSEAAPPASGPPIVETLLALSTRMFAAHGYEGTSIRDISQAAGVSIAALYHHFRSKEQLYAEVCEQKFGDFHSSVMERLASVPPSERTAACVAVAFFDVLVEDPELFFLIQRNMQHLAPDRVNQRVLACYQSLRDLINQTLNFSTAACAPDALSYSLDALVNGHCALALADVGGPAERAAHIDRHREYLRTFVNYAFGNTRSR